MLSSVWADDSPRPDAPSAKQKKPDPDHGAKLWHVLNPRNLRLQSTAALVVDRYGNELYSKNADRAQPIASITKLMTAMVILDSPLPMRQELVITDEDRDLLRMTGSRLKPGATLTREQLIKLALMSSENRAASALARTFPAGRKRFIYLMNKKALSLGMRDTKFTDPTGLDVGNSSTPRDLYKLVQAAMRYPFIRKATTSRSAQVYPYLKKGHLRFGNTNRLLSSESWEISLSKTGYINEAGRCLVMQAQVSGQDLTIILLNSFGKLTPYGDSNRIRKWVENGVKNSSST
ncbi:MAG: serine hydrolase [Gammaproteobacteria bacterium]|nr:serine hydrolase [Gammaproteobacteria bacterium]